jgi:RNA polymerase sigma factor (sigma-70 family)
LGEVDVRRLTELVEGDRGRIRYIVQALCGTQLDADGVVAEAIARAVERLMAGRSIEDLRAWVTSVAVNLGRSEMRRQTVRRRYAPLLASSTANDDGTTESIALRLDVEAALRQLPRRQAQVVALRYGLDLSIGDIAACLHRSEGTVKATLFKARRRLEATFINFDGGDHRGSD